MSGRTAVHKRNGDASRSTRPLRQSGEGREIPEAAAALPTEEGKNPGVREREMAREPNPVKRFLKVLGPGLVTGASDDDPSGIGTYSAAGASLGYSILWTSLFTFPIMASVQYICAKVGMVTGMGDTTTSAIVVLPCSVTSSVARGRIAAVSPRGP